MTADIVVPMGLHSEPLAQRVGNIIVPPPVGMIEVSDYSDRFRKIAGTYKNKPFGLYYLLSEFRDIDDDVGILASRSAVGSISFTAGTTSQAKTQFKKYMEEGERDIGRMKFSAAEFQNLMNEARRRVDANMPALKIAVKGMSVVDMDFTRSDRGISVALVNSAFVNQGKQIEITLVYCMGWQLVRNNIVNLVYLMPLKDSSTPNSAKASMDAWMDSIQDKSASSQ